VKIYWGRVFVVVGLLLLIAGFLWLHNNADAVHDTWRSFSHRISDLSGSDTLRFCFYLVGGVTEVRIFPKERYIYTGNRRKYTGKVVSGYYTDYGKLASDVEPFDRKASIYITINPCKPELLARARNRLRLNARVTTNDSDILCDLWFPFDTDPVRPANISSTDDELKAALAKRDEVAKFLSRWAKTVKGMSGNGGHGLIRLMGYPNNQETRQAKRRLTQFLSDRFSDWEVDSDGDFILDERGKKILRQDGVSVDNTVYNLIFRLFSRHYCEFG
jgi:hypothetical protein